MQLIKNTYLFWPLVLFCGLFLIDKLFLLDMVKRYTIPWNKIEPMMYESRTDLFEQLKNHYPKMQKNGQRPGLILGTSRSAEFSSDEIAKHMPESVTYNFSAPLASPSFHYYWLQEILNAGIKPAFVIAEADPILFSRTAVNYSLSYSYDLKFMLTHTEPYREIPPDIWDIEGRGFSVDETDTFLLKRMFALYRFPAKLPVIEENADSMAMPEEGRLTIKPRYAFKNEMQKQIQIANETRYGGIPNPALFEVPEERMEADARNMMNLHLSNRKPAATQVLFLKKTIALCAKEGIPLVVYWPVASRPLRKMLEESGLSSLHRKGIQKTIHNSKARDSYKGSPVVFSDPDSDSPLQCRSFVDSNHLSGGCYPELTKVILENLKSAGFD